MKILIVYATYSGGTQTVSQLIADKLTSLGNSVALKQTHEISPDEIAGYDAILFGSPSWLQDGKDGQPHIGFFNLMGTLKGSKYENKKFAVYGLGDSSYAHFCGAVDHLIALVKDLQGTLIGEPLRVDGFYFNQKENEKRIDAWVTVLNQKLA